MYVNLKTKIWLTVLTIVLLFSFFTLYYFPEKEGKALLTNFNNQVQNLASTVALGVNIALKEQNYEGVETAMEFVKETPGLKFVSLLENDTLWDADKMNYTISKSVFITYPESFQHIPDLASSDSMLIKEAPFQTVMMTGAIQVGFSTDQIKENLAKVRNTSLIVSGGIFLVGLLIGIWLARSISLPVRALRNAARLVGQGDLTQVIKKYSRDEIGDLSQAFNLMVQDLSKTREELIHTNMKLSESNTLLQSTLDNLKSTQTQLIQSEKMASLGELTAGIAHEIQNPLNFVNNFAEVNSELISEMKLELDKGNLDDAKDISNTVDENEQKILFHGKRADAIVKGMLQHSRTSSGVKEPTDINALADEYLRLAYHGLRAKDKSFNATMKTDFDESIDKIDIIPQDIGRVILNLITNAFFAVNERTKQQMPDYDPIVTVSTRKTADRILISIEDNGNGIPPSVLDKIFQPFFTTKPTGQGTGLGLSLSYDIVQAHGGELKVETKEGEGCEFVIQLPN